MLDEWLNGGIDDGLDAISGLWDESWDKKPKGVTWEDDLHDDKEDFAAGVYD